jgi:superfamily II DNA or RNA helicase
LSDDFDRNELILAAVAEEAEEEQVLVLSHRREHCMVLDQRLVGLGVRTGFLIGGADYRVEFDRSVQGIEAGTIRVGVGTFQAIGQGLDLPSVSVGVCATPIAANRQVFNQVRGRFCRTSDGKETARLYYPWDRKVFGNKHLQNLVQWNANVVIRQEGQWMPAREYLRQWK